MKNADMPAMPLPLGTETEKWCQGLTKREVMAMHMMAHLMMSERLSSYEEQVGYSIKATDALLAELGRTK